MTAEPRWWTMRRAQSLKPASYRCPFCSKQLHAMSAHVLVMPEGDTDKRGHAHLECVAAERAAGRMLDRSEWLKTQPRAPGPLARLRGRLKRN